MINSNNKKNILNAFFCRNVVLTVAFEQFNAPLLKKGIYFLNFWTVAYISYLAYTRMNCLTNYNRYFYLDVLKVQ